MVQVTKKLIDLTKDLEKAAKMGASFEVVEHLLGRGLETLGRLVPFDLATVMELEGEELRVRLARGILANAKVEEHRISLAQFPTIRKILESGSAKAFTEEDHIEEGDAFDGVLDLPKGHWCMVVPLRLGDEPIGIMTFDRQVCGYYPDNVVELADIFGHLMGIALTYSEQSALLKRLNEQIKEQNRLLREKWDENFEASQKLIRSQSPVMKELTRLAQQVAITDTPVLITGETGTGKEVLARAIHEWSPRRDRPFVSVNCAVLPPALIESELFGHVKGAFSGANTRRIGRFQAANGGTLFLDEIAELPTELQAKLLRVLQEGSFEPLGSDRTIRVDVRILAATNVDLHRALEKGTFREDLYYRLAVFPLELPPLRQRKEDIPIIAEHFLHSLAKKRHSSPWQLTQDSLRWLQKQDWRGNVRELINTLERATILQEPPFLHLPLTSHSIELPSPPERQKLSIESIPSLRDVERKHIEHVLRLTNGKIYGKGGAAEILGLNPNTLRSRMKKLGLGGARDFSSKGDSRPSNS